MSTDDIEISNLAKQYREDLYNSSLTSRLQYVTTPELSFSELDDRKKMVAEGFVPAGDPEELINFYRNVYLGWSVNDTIFWSGIVYQSFATSKWKMYRYSSLVNMAVTNADSSALLLVAPDALYASNRPRTDMSMFRTPSSITVKTKTNFVGLMSSRININGEEWNVLPVTRYATGMSKGLYYKEEQPTGTCGTFYYHEAQSDTYLAYNRAFTARNKTDAVDKLLRNNKAFIKKYTSYDGGKNKDYIKEDLDKLMAVNALIYKPGYLYTPQQVYSLMEDTYSAWYEDLTDTVGDVKAVVKTCSNTPRYAGQTLGWYAEEDVLDQALCQMARESGYDIVILTEMAGAYQVVTEVLDTRNRLNSFDSLVYYTA